MRSGQLHDDTSQVGYLLRGGSPTRLEAELKATQRHNEETYLNSVREDFGVLSLGAAIRLKRGRMSVEGIAAVTCFQHRLRC